MNNTIVMGILIALALVGVRRIIEAFRLPKNLGMSMCLTLKRGTVPTGHPVVIVYHNVSEIRYDIGFQIWSKEHDAYATFAPECIDGFFTVPEYVRRSTFSSFEGDKPS